MHFKLKTIKYYSNLFKAPGYFDLKTSAWFYGIWISLFLILLGVILLMFLKKYTDQKWDEKGLFVALNLITFELFISGTEYENIIIFMNLFYKYSCFVKMAEAEIEEEIRRLQAEEAAERMGIFNAEAL